MILASELRSGMAIRYENQVYKVVAADYHPGQGKMGGVTHARLRNVNTGTFWEHSFRADLKIETLSLDKKPMDYLYKDGELHTFMDPNTFEQVAVPESVVGERARFLSPDIKVSLEFIEDSPLDVLFPDVIEVLIVDTAPPTHGQQDSTWKTARLENGVEIMVPQFVKNGDQIRLDLTTLKYMDRAKAEKK